MKAEVASENAGKRQTLVQRIAASLPGTRQKVQRDLSDVPSLSVMGTLQRMLDRGLVSRRGAVFVSSAPSVVEVKESCGVPAPDEDNGESCGVITACVASWGEDASQSPQVPCGVFGQLALSSCIDNYTSAAAGHRSSNKECANCQVGRQRRSSFSGCSEG